MNIIVEKLNENQLKNKNVFNWEIWEKDVSKFDWHYDTTEECYILEGKVIVEDEKGEKVEFGKGDFVTFQKGLDCVWDIKEPVRKHYNFK